MQLTRLALGATKLPAITSKRGNKNFYKGRGAPARALGRITNKGQFHLVPEKVDQFLFQVPTLEGFTLKPYIQSSTADPLGRETYLKR